MTGFVYVLQVTLVLKDRLHELGVEVNVKTFEATQRTAGLGDDLFVSLKLTQHSIINCPNHTSVEHGSRVIIYRYIYRISVHECHVQGELVLLLQSSYFGAKHIYTSSKKYRVIATKYISIVNCVKMQYHLGVVYTFHVSESPVIWDCLVQLPLSELICMAWL